MSDGTTISKAYVQILPTTKGIAGELGKVMEGEGEKAGESAGKKFTSKFSDSLKSAGSKITSASTKITVGLGAAFTGVAAASTAAWKEVDEAMDTITIKTGASGDALADMQNRAQNLATTIPISFQEAGDAVGEVNTRFGLTGDALEELSGQFAKFASLNGTDVSASIDAVQTSMAAFGLQSKDAGNMLDVLNKAGQDTGVNVVQLASELAANAGTLKTFGYNASDAAMLLANLGKNGVDSASAMMGLKKVYAESVKTGKPMNDILSELTAKLQNSKTATEAAQEAAELFGSRAAASLIPALQDGRLSFDALGTSIDSFAGNVSSTYSETLNPLDQMTVNMNLLKQAGSDLVNAAAPLITEGMTGITQAIQTAQPAFREFLSTFAENGQTIVSSIAPMMNTSFATLGSVVTTLTTAWNGLSDSQQKLAITEAVSDDSEGYETMIKVTAKTKAGQMSADGTYLHEPKIIKVNGYWVDVKPEGNMFIAKYKDIPGSIGAIGTKFGEQNINIGIMQVGRDSSGGEAIMILTLDEPATKESVEEIKQLENVYDATSLIL